MSPRNISQETNVLAENKCMSFDMVVSPPIGIGEPLTDAYNPTSMLDPLSEILHQYRISDHVITCCSALWAALYGVDQRARSGDGWSGLISTSTPLTGQRSFPSVEMWPTVTWQSSG